MPRWLRFVIALVLAAALPLNGVAAAAMQHCAPHSIADVDEHHDLDQHHHADAAVVQDAARHHHGDIVVADADDAGLHHPSDHTLVAKTKCSACAACCAGAAIPASSMQVGAALPADSVVSHGRAPASAFLTAGPERPPRTFLA